MKRKIGCTRTDAVPPTAPTKVAWSDDYQALCQQTLALVYEHAFNALLACAYADCPDTRPISNLLRLPFVCAGVAPAPTSRIGSMERALVVSFLSYWAYGFRHHTSGATYDDTVWWFMRKHRVANARPLGFDAVPMDWVGANASTTATRINVMLRGHERTTTEAERGRLLTYLIRAVDRVPTAHGRATTSRASDRWLRDVVEAFVVPFERTSQALHRLARAVLRHQTTRDWSTLMACSRPWLSLIVDYIAYHSEQRSVVLPTCENPTCHGLVRPPPQDVPWRLQIAARMLGGDRLGARVASHTGCNILGSCTGFCSAACRDARARRCDGAIGPLMLAAPCRLAMLQTRFVEYARRRARLKRSAERDASVTLPIDEWARDALTETLRINKRLAALLHPNHPTKVMRSASLEAIVATLMNAHVTALLRLDDEVARVPPERLRYTPVDRHGDVHDDPLMAVLRGLDRDLARRVVRHTTKAKVVATEWPHVARSTLMTNTCITVCPTGSN